MAQDTSGLRYLAQLELGVDALQWFQAELNERAAWARIGMAAECGWVGEWIGGNASFGWEVYDAGSGVLAVRSTGSDGTPMFYGKVRGDTTKPVIGVDRGGRILEQPVDSELLDANDDGLVAPNDGVWRTIVANFRVRQREPGTLTLTGGSTTVTGVGTQFTRYSDSSDPGGASRIRIDADDTLQGNEGTYLIDTITDDETLTLVATPPANESGVEFRIAGTFYDASPADPDMHNNAQITWSLETRTTTRPTTGLIAYDVKRSGGVCTFIDRRHANLWRPIDARTRCYALLPATLYYTNYDNTSGGGPGDSAAVSEATQFYDLATGQATARTMIAMAAAPCATGSELAGLAEDQATGMMVAMLWDDNSTRRIRILHYTLATLDIDLGDATKASAGAWDDPDNGSAVNVATTVAGALDVALVALPVNSGNTHLLLYINASGVLVAHFTTDNGATWDAGATILTPASGSLLAVSAVLTRMNRIVVACAWSASPYVRYIYSDNLGASWLTNTSAGYSGSATDEAARDVSLVQDDGGNLWTVAVVTSENTLRLYRGAGEGDAVADTDEQSTGWKIGPEGDAVVTHVEAFACPNGSIGLIYGHVAAGTDFGALGYMQVARRRVVHHAVLVTSPLSTPFGTAPTIDDTLPVCAGVSAGGVLHIAYGNRYSTTGPLYNLRAHFLTYVPVEVPRPNLWYGGQ